MTASEDRGLTRLLVRWFRKSARDLPWRRHRNGYTALVAEIMLQQTQAARVVASFERFINRFPDLQSLASADEQDVLAMWNGLGYYRRARHLYAAARAIVLEHGGIMPHDIEALMRLPGVGRYTAGSICSIVFNQRQPIVDGNVRRVLARLSARRCHEPRDEWSWRRAGELVKVADSPSEFNEAMMELGATICTPALPRCERCPWASVCQANRLGAQDSFPGPAARVKPRRLFAHTVIITRKRGTEFLVQQRSARGMWSNMWQPPTVESSRRLRPAQLASSLGIAFTGLQRVGSFEHATTHRLISFQVYRASAAKRVGRWCELDQLEALPMSNAHRRALAMAMPTRASLAARGVRAVRSALCPRSGS